MLKDAENSRGPGTGFRRFGTLGKPVIRCSIISWVRFHLLFRFRLMSSLCIGGQNVSVAGQRRASLNR